MENWLPIENVSDVSHIGKMLAESSLFGPLFRLSVFAEDDPKIVTMYFPEASTPAEIAPETFNLISKQIHPLLGSTRVLKLLYNSRQVLNIN
jgi:hypothetical protein